MKKPSRNGLLLVFLLATLVLGIQLTAIARPYRGHYANYQVVMAVMARNMLRDNFSDLLQPKTDLLVAGQKSLHLNQYPFPSVLAALGIKAFGGTLEFWGRFQAIVFNFLTAIVLGLLGAILFGWRTGWIASVVYALSPYTMIYGQGFFSEPMALFTLVFSLYLLLERDQKSISWSRLFLSGLCLSMAVTARVHFAVFYPVYFVCLANRLGIKRWVHLLFYLTVSVSMPLAWYAYTYWVSIRSDHVLTNIFLQMGMRRVGDHNYLANPDYYRTILDSVSQMMLTPLLFPFLFLGFVEMARKRDPGSRLTLGFLACGMLPVLLSPQKVMAHDFYLYGVFPFVAVTAAFGLDWLFSKVAHLRRSAVMGLLILGYFAVSARYFVHPIFRGGEEDKNVARVAQAIQTFTAPEAKLIIAGNGPAVMHYYADRPSWTMEFDGIGMPLPSYLTNSRFSRVDPVEITREENAMKHPVTWLEYLRSRGASYFVAASKRELEALPDLLNYLREYYSELSRPGDDFHIFQLTSPLKKPASLWRSR